MNIAFFHNLKQLLISIDQLVQVVVGLIVSMFLWSHKIDADETMSAYCHRHNKYWYGRVMEFVVNCIMYLPEKLIYKLQWGHCKRAYEQELKGTYGRDII